MRSTPTVSPAQDPAAAPRARSGTRAELRELAVDGAILLVLMAGTFWLVGGAVPFTRPFWLDEMHTILVASRPGYSQVLGDLLRAGDTNTPLLHTALWLLGRLTGGLSPLKVRVFIFLLVWLGLTVTAGVLRRYVPRAAALAGAAVLWAHPLVQEHAVEARYYGPWLLLCALLAYVLPPADRAPTRRRELAVAVVAAMLCTIHYFGILTWGLIAAATVWRYLPDVRRAARALLPLLAGPLALAACIPLYLGQRGVLSVATWIPPLSVSQILGFAALTFAWPATVIVLLVLGADAVLRPHAPAPERRAGTDLWTLVAVGVLPAVLIVFSAVMQPTLLPRYALPSLLLMAPLVAFGFARSSPLARVGVGVLILGSGVAGIRRLANNNHAFVAEVHRWEDALRAPVAAGTLVVSTTRHPLYALVGDDPALGRAIRFVDLPDPAATQALAPGSEAALARDLYVIERDMARVHQRLYGFPRLLPVAELRRVDRVILLSQVHALTTENVARFGREWMPGYTVREMAPGVHEFSRAPGGAPLPAPPR